MAYTDLSKREFGFLTAIKPLGRTKDRRVLWECVCICGNIKVVSSKNLLTGRTKCCGCVTKQMQSESHITHGFRIGRNMPRIYKTWLNMKDRCYNPHNKDYRLYGERGIIVCEEWRRDFLTFHDWAMKNGYADNLEIDRINSNGNYEPGNCRFVTDLVQARNTSHCFYYDIGGEKLCRNETAERFDTTASAIIWRTQHQGKSIEEAVGI